MFLPPHGQIDCGRCFPETVEWGQPYRPGKGWQLERNPCAWGSRNPSVLVLGFSKGANQTVALNTMPFKDVPFSRMRKHLSAILRTVEVLHKDEEIDGHINDTEGEFAFGSLIRCSISKLDPVTQRYAKSGNIINALATYGGGNDSAANCTAQFMATFPPNLRLVVMLSNDDAYIAACFELLRRLHTNLRMLNAVAYATNQVRFVHVVHPSGASGRHINDWLNGTTGKQAGKREMAIQAIKMQLTPSDRN